MYLAKEKIAEIRKEIKNIFPTKEGWKFSITQSYGGINIDLMKSPLSMDMSGGRSVNPYYTHEIECENKRNVFGVIVKNCTRIAGYHGIVGEYDHFADYQNYNYSLNLSIGKWDKPCIFID